MTMTTSSPSYNAPSSPCDVAASPAFGAGFDDACVEGTANAPAPSAPSMTGSREAERSEMTPAILIMSVLIPIDRRDVEAGYGFAADRHATGYLLSRRTACTKVQECGWPMTC